MPFIRKLRHRLRALVDREALDAELDDELRFHLGRQIAQFVGQGMDPAAARTEALRLFGGVEKVKEECRDERPVSLIDQLVQDVGYAVRTLNKSRGFALLAIATLALGIGANAAIFSVVNGVLLAPLPYLDGDDLMVVVARAPGAGMPQANFCRPRPARFAANRKTEWTPTAPLFGPCGSSVGLPTGRVSTVQGTRSRCWRRERMPAATSMGRAVSVRAS